MFLLLNSHAKPLPADNLSTWLSTRYATKKNEENLGLWLAEKRQKLDNGHELIVKPLSDESLDSWLQPEMRKTPDALKNVPVELEISPSFPLPESHQLPLSDWLASSAVEDQMKSMNLEEDNNVSSWLDENDFDDDDESELDQWLVVPSSCPSESSVRDDTSSVIVLDEEHTKSSGSWLW